MVFYTASPATCQRQPYVDKWEPFSIQNNPNVDKFEPSLTLFGVPNSGFSAGGIQEFAAPPINKRRMKNRKDIV